MNVFEIFKFLILIMIFLICMYIGKLLSKKYVYRLKEIESIYSALSIFKTKLKFTYEPLPEIFEDISKKIEHQNISSIFKNAKENMKQMPASTSWQKAIDDAKEVNITKEDKEILKTMSKLLRTN